MRFAACPRGQAGASPDEWTSSTSAASGWPLQLGRTSGPRPPATPPHQTDFLDFCCAWQAPPTNNGLPRLMLHPADRCGSADFPPDKRTRTSSAAAAPCRPPRPGQCPPDEQTSSEVPGLLLLRQLRPEGHFGPTGSPPPPFPNY
jgi:hypothetical protein